MAIKSQEELDKNQGAVIGEGDPSGESMDENTRICLGIGNTICSNAAKFNVTIISSWVRSADGDRPHLEIIIDDNEHDELVIDVMPNAQPIVIVEVLAFDINETLQLSDPQLFEKINVCITEVTQGKLNEIQ